MTLKEFQDKKDYYYREYKYYAWACCQPSCTQGQDEVDVRKRNEYYERYKKLKDLENKILENGLKDIDKANY